MYRSWQEFEIIFPGALIDLKEKQLKTGLLMVVKKFKHVTEWMLRSIDI
jgi:hypothetical protein